MRIQLTGLGNWYWPLGREATAAAPGVLEAFSQWMLLLNSGGRLAVLSVHNSVAGWTEVTAVAGLSPSSWTQLSIWLLCTTGLGWPAARICGCACGGVASPQATSSVAIVTAVVWLLSESRHDDVTPSILLESGERPAGPAAAAPVIGIDNGRVRTGNVLPLFQQSKQFHFFILILITWK